MVFSHHFFQGGLHHKECFQDCGNEMELSFKFPSLKHLQNALLTMPLWIFHIDLDKVRYIATLDTMNFLHPLIALNAIGKDIGKLHLQPMELWHGFCHLHCKFMLFFVLVVNLEPGFFVARVAYPSHAVAAQMVGKTVPLYRQ